MATKTFINDEGYEYTSSNKRLRYTPELHDMHGTKWSDDDKSYLVKMKETMSYKDISLALGRTMGVCAEKYCQLKKKRVT